MMTPDEYWAQEVTCSDCPTSQTRSEMKRYAHRDWVCQDCYLRRRQANLECCEFCNETLDRNEEMCACEAMDDPDLRVTVPYAQQLYIENQQREFDRQHAEVY